MVCVCVCQQRVSTWLMVARTLAAHQVACWCVEAAAAAAGYVRSGPVPSTGRGPPAPAASTPA